MSSVYSLPGRSSSKPGSPSSIFPKAFSKAELEKHLAAWTTWGQLAKPLLREEHLPSDPLGGGVQDPPTSCHGFALHPNGWSRLICSSKKPHFILGCPHAFTPPPAPRFCRSSPGPILKSHPCESRFPNWDLRDPSQSQVLSTWR